MIGPLFTPITTSSSLPANHADDGIPTARQRKLTLNEPSDLGDDEPVLYIDGGTAFRNNSTASNHGFSLGDGDSSTQALDETLPKDKDFSDLAYALSNLPAQFSHVELLGFIGARRDHEWINLGEAANFLSQRHKATRIRFNRGDSCEQIDGFSSGDWIFTHNDRFSLICIKAAEVALSGDVRYPIQPSRQLAPLSSLGLSNQANGAFSLSCNQPFFLITAPP